MTVIKSFRFSNAFVYYGLSLNTASLGGNPYINFLLSGAVEFPAYLYIWWSFAKFGRIKPFGFIFILAGISLLAIMAVPQGKGTHFTQLYNHIMDSICSYDNITCHVSLVWISMDLLRVNCNSYTL